MNQLVTQEMVTLLLVSSEDDEVVDTETRVREATQCLQTNNDSIITIGLPSDALEHEAVSQFMTSG